MVFVWRGIGIIVPIIIFITAYIVSFWIKDTTLGNSNFMGWTLFYSAIVCLLVGLLAPGIGKRVAEDGTKVPAKKHDFFFIPMIFWGPLLGAISAWLLLSSPDKTDEKMVAEEASEVADTIRTLRFYNPGADTLYYVFSDESGYFEKKKIAPFSSIEKKAPNESYLLACLTLTGEPMLALPSSKDYDTSDYIQFKEGDAVINQRKIPKPTPDKNDYDVAWLLADSRFDMAVVDVTDLYTGTIKKEKVAEINWKEKLQATYQGNELIEPVFKPQGSYTSIYVASPNTALPVSLKEKQAAYVLFTFPAGKELTNEYIAEKISRLIL